MAHAIRSEQVSSNVHAFPRPQVRDAEVALYEAKEGSALHGLTEEQRIAVVELIQAERKHAVTWWTYLNEMRARKQLPEWVSKQSVGTGPEYDRYRSDCEALNLGLFGSRSVYSAGSYCSVEFDA
ncbi:hypothetical protein [Pseudomonas chlororaphis]|uniref:hypothetical protein n=1 Tax=Pseudomonas chlororaphis TaxID=587753 RepID=UPI002D773730|nr:hypothetical protein [Pseudomonas chlororaphis]